MQYRPLGRSTLQVSVLSLGTMTWGEQNTEAQAHAQLDLAVEAGINMVDTAELYPVPPKPETQGLTEAYIGSWLHATPSNRDRIVLATKATAPSHTVQRPSHIRGGQLSFTKANLERALNESLQRLRTDHVDLYQLHWPDRSTNTFGQRGYQHVEGESTVPIDETLEALDQFVRSGKVRQVGVSNETPWGLSQFLNASQNRGLARVASIQNPYSLLNRGFETGLAEFSMREQVGLLAYSPLAFGVLSGKYLAGNLPKDSRLALFERFARYKSQSSERAAYEYVQLFRRHGLDPAQAALAFVTSRPFVTSTIIGVTTLDQLQSNLGSVDVVLSDEVLAGIEAIQNQWPDPAP